ELTGPVQEGPLPVCSRVSRNAIQAAAPIGGTGLDQQDDPSSHCQFLSSIAQPDGGADTHLSCVNSASPQTLVAPAACPVSCHGQRPISSTALLLCSAMRRLGEDLRILDHI